MSIASSSVVGTEDSLNSRSLHDWYDQSIHADHMRPRAVASQSHASRMAVQDPVLFDMTSFSANGEASDVSFEVPATILARVNDSLRACGLDPTPRNAPVGDVMRSCVDAVEELSRRNRELAERRPEVRTVFQRPISPVRGPAGPTPADPNDHCELQDDLRRLRKVSLGQRQRIETLERQLRSRESELEKLKTYTQEKAKEEDKRNALAMTTLREQKLGSNSFMVVNNFIKQIDVLEKENEALDRRCQTLTVRLRQQGSASHENAQDEKAIEAIQRELNEVNEIAHQLTRESEEKDALISQQKREIDNVVNQMYELKEELLFNEKQRMKKSSPQSSPKFDSASEMVASLRELLQVGADEYLIPAVDRLLHLSNEVLPLLESFAVSLASRIRPGKPFESSDPRAFEELRLEIAHLLNDRQTVSMIERALAPLSPDETELVPRIQKLVGELGMYRSGHNPVIRDITQLVQPKTPNLLIPTLQRSLARIDELSNFYTSVVALLGLRKGCSYAECVRQIQRLQGGSCQPGIQVSENPENGPNRHVAGWEAGSSSGSDSSTVSNLALRRELLSIYRPSP